MVVKKMLGILFVMVLIALSGCARLSDSTKAKGGIIGSYKAPYIIISQSGGEIMDVYKLNDAIVQSPSGSDGWLFLDQNENPIYVGGDVKTIRLKSTNDELWSKYNEYHMEFETISYREKYHKLE